MKILVTAGPTWVEIDPVRILTNVFTGNTGLILAKALSKKGHQVTLLINPHCLVNADLENIKVVKFRYFDEFRQQVLRLLKNENFSAVIHSAAVSDYLAIKSKTTKIKSGQNSLNIKLKPAEKIIALMRKIRPEVFLVQFKLETESRFLIARARESLRRNKSDLVVANAYPDLQKGYKAYIIGGDQPLVCVRSRQVLADKLELILKQKG